MPATALDRCLRCGTRIRNSRKTCPSCGMDLNATAPTPQEAPAAESAQPQQAGHVIKKVAAKAGVKMCMICMASVPEDQMVEQDGQKICPGCAENIRNKAMKKAAGPPPSPKK